MARPERRFRMSLARKLSLLTGVVIALSLLIVLGVAYEVLTRSAISGAYASLDRATRQLASVAESNIRLSRARWDSVAHHPALRRAIAVSPRDSSRHDLATDSTIATALRTLSRLTSPVDSGLPTELWSANGQRVTAIGTDEPVMPESPANERSLGRTGIPRIGLEELAPHDSLQFGRLYASGGRVYFWLVQPILEKGKPIGYIAQQRRLASNPQADRSVRALAGEGVSMYYHNSDGSVWSTVGGSPAAPSHPNPDDPTLATRVASQELLTAEAAVAGTPLVITMESRVADVLASSRRTLRDLMLVALGLLIAGMGAALLIGRGVARPIVAIAAGAEAIARGEYETRVATSGDAEVVRLASSFNHMANEVAVAQRALEQKTADAQSASRAKSDFLATVSHELRTPLNAIAGYTELLEMGLRGPLTDAQRRDLARIRASGQHLLGLISGVLDLNRIERGTVTYTLVPIAIDQFLSDLDALVSPQAAAKSLTLDYVPSERSLTVLADREKLRQIILNLLSNAIRYTPAGGRIRLSSSPLGTTQVAIRVEDTGPGIPADRRSQVFEPFVQLDRSLTQPQEGLGLGLAISRDLARGLGGDLTLTEGATGGASFLLTLPQGATGQLSDSRTSGETAASRSA